MIKDAYFLRYFQNNFFPMHFDNLVAKQNFLVATQDNDKNEWEMFGNDW